MKKKVTQLLNKTGRYTGKHEIKRLLRFAVTGCANTLVDFLVFMLLTKAAGIHYGISQVISYSCGVLNSFILNRLWTFGDVRHDSKTSGQLVRFVSVNLFSLSATLLSLKILVDLLLFNVTLSKVIVIALSQAVNYIGYRAWVFKK